MVNIVVILAILALFLLRKGRNMSLRALLKRIWFEYGDLMDRAPVSNYILTAVIAQESGGDPTVIGGTPDYGLMQITAPALEDFNVNNNKWYTLNDMLDPRKNIEVGSWYLSWLLNQFGGNTINAFRAYNAGIGNVKNDPTGTVGREYATQVSSKLDELLSMETDGELSSNVT